MSSIRRIDCAEARDRAPFFVLGALDARGMAEVRDHLATCDQPHPEFAELGGIVPYLAELVEPMDAGPELRERVMAIVAADARAQVRDDVAAERYIATFGTERRAAADTTAPAIPDTTALPVAADGAPALASDATAPGIDGIRRDRPAELWVDAPGRRPDGTAPIGVAERARSRNAFTRWILPAAAALVIAVLGAWNISLQQQASDVGRRAAELRTAIATSADPTARVAKLAGSGTAAGATGFAAFTQDGSGVLVIEGLAPAPTGRTYQGWYINGNQILSAGLVTVQGDGLALVTGLHPPSTFDTFALTLEKAGGEDQPQNLPPIVAGTVGT